MSSMNPEMCIWKIASEISMQKLSKTQKSLALKLSFQTHLTPVRLQILGRRLVGFRW